jgi:hypothetical protein
MGDKVAFQWGSDQELSFVSTKSAITTAPVLCLPNPTEPYVLTTDARDYSIGGVLEQEHEDDLPPGDDCVT